MDGPRFSRFYLESALRWFERQFDQGLVGPIQSQFPNWPMPREIKEILRRAEAIRNILGSTVDDPVSLADFFTALSGEVPSPLDLFKRIVLMYRRNRASETERSTEKTFHLELTASLEEEIKAFDLLIAWEPFLQLADTRLPLLKDFLPVQFIETLTVAQAQFSPRQYDEKFHVLQAPQLFLADVSYFRAKCGEREAPLAIAFIDIDNFKSFNTRYTDTKVDRNLLPRFMQAIEAHVYYHGYAYRQGGDEYLMLVPSLSKSLAINFLDELRMKLGDLVYPDIAEKTTVSIGVCIAEPDCPLTDRELLNRANSASQFAKKNGKNCIATFRAAGFTDQDLEIVSQPTH